MVLHHNQPGVNCTTFQLSLRCHIYIEVSINDHPQHIDKHVTRFCLKIELLRWTVCFKQSIWLTLAQKALCCCCSLYVSLSLTGCQLAVSAIWMVWVSARFPRPQEDYNKSVTSSKLLIDYKKVEVTDKNDLSHFSQRFNDIFRSYGLTRSNSVGFLSYDDINILINC